MLLALSVYFNRQIPKTTNTAHFPKFCSITATVQASQIYLLWYHSDNLTSSQTSTLRENSAALNNRKINQHVGISVWYRCTHCSHCVAYAKCFCSVSHILLDFMKNGLSALQWKAV